MIIDYDMQIVERGRGLTMELVSIGLVREDGAYMYAINEECLSNVMRHPWLATTAVPHLPIRSDDTFIFEWNKEHEEYQYVLALDRLIAEVLKFITENDKPDLWAYYGAYKHVVLSQLFGSQAERPARMPMFTHELQQLSEERPHVLLPAVPENTFHAMADARWVNEARLALMGEYKALPSAESLDIVVPKHRRSVLGWGDVYEAEILEEHSK
jgi:hypothetical protein